MEDAGSKDLSDVAAHHGMPADISGSRWLKE